ncbi:MAG: 3-dehydroquinate synthase, partial [Flavobacteriaceae bacterium]|nr:3-dehydroquinate synthase [Flavobacteriaceae bacterium]
ESYFLEQTNMKSLLHGEAIAIGMILETFISTKLLNFPKSALEEVTETFTANYPLIPIQTPAQNAIINLMKFDKKNEGGRINFVLLEQIGKPKIDCQVENQLIKEAFHYYNKSLEVS